MPPNSAYHLVRRNAGMCATWAAFAAACLAFAASPWVYLAVAGRLPRWPAGLLVVLLLLAWSAFPLALGGFVLFQARCRIELWGARGRVRRRASWVWMSEAEYPLDRAYLVHRWHHSRHGGGGAISEVLFIRSGRHKRGLADEPTCADLSAVSRWLCAATGVKLLDARHRARASVPSRPTMGRTGPAGKLRTGREPVRSISSAGCVGPPFRPGTCPRRA